MPYTQDSLEDILSEREKVLRNISDLTFSFARLSENLKHARAKEYLMHGVCRRLQIIAHCIDKIFLIFPPNRQDRLDREELFDVQISLHAFVINLYGILDNLAWVYVHEYDLAASIGGRNKVGLFHSSTLKYFPDAVVRYIESSQEWYTKYIKNYRDALAHRIPLYIAPFVLKTAEAERWRELDAQIALCLKAHNFECMAKLQAERDSLGVVSDTFTHSFYETESISIFLHPQVISDASTIIELGNICAEHFTVAPN